MEGWQDACESLWQLAKPLGIVSKPVPLAHFVAQSGGEDVVLATGAENHAGPSNTSRDYLWAWAAMEAWQHVIIPQVDHDVMLWLPDEEWMQLEEVGGWETGPQVKELRL